MLWKREQGWQNKALIDVEFWNQLCLVVCLWLRLGVKTEFYSSARDTLSLWARVFCGPLAEGMIAYLELAPLCLVSAISEGIPLWGTQSRVWDIYIRYTWGYSPVGYSGCGRWGRHAWKAYTIAQVQTALQWTLVVKRQPAVWYNTWSPKWDQALSGWIIARIFYLFFNCPVKGIHSIHSPVLHSNGQKFRAMLTCSQHWTLYLGLALKGIVN